MQFFQVTKCAECEQALQVPAVHFLCKHSFHLPCFRRAADGREQCPACLDRSRPPTPPSQGKKKSAHAAFQEQVGLRVRVGWWERPLGSL